MSSKSWSLPFEIRQKAGKMRYKKWPKAWFKAFCIGRRGFIIDFHYYYCGREKVADYKVWHSLVVLITPVFIMNAILKVTLYISLYVLCKKFDNQTWRNLIIWNLIGTLKGPIFSCKEYLVPYIFGTYDFFFQEIR